MNALLRPQRGNATILITLAATTRTDLDEHKGALNAHRSATETFGTSPRPTGVATALAS